MGRIDPVHARKPLRAVHRLGDLRHRHAGGIGGQHHVLSHQPADLFPEGMLDVHLFGNGLENKVRLGKAVFGCGHGDSLQQRLGLRLCQGPLLHLCLLVDGNQVVRLLQGSLGHAVEIHPVIPLGKDLREGRAHDARARDDHGMNA